MGGDHGLPVTLEAAASFAVRQPEASLLLVGDEPQIRARLTHLRQEFLRAVAMDANRVSIRHASEVVAMDDAIETALRRKKDSSMRVAIDLVKSGEADAVVSAGNTGALMAIARYVLKTLDGIERPAIASALPNMKGSGTTVLDLGANVDCAPEHLLQFAIMGAALVASLEGKASPSVGLLNIGEEMIKGNEVVKEAAELIRNSGLNFHGNVEGNDIFKGTTDVVVCDGFTGNVALKTSEGLAQMLGEFIKQEFTRGLWSKGAALVSYPILMRFKKRVDHRRYNGAALLGLKGIVVKSHGSADAYAFEWAIKRAYDAAHGGLFAGMVAQVDAYRRSHPVLVKRSDDATPAEAI